ncbi:hypothetical protein [Rhizobium tumorigenes]|uniref:hypothetical protein n=1 Tax=Rhizobium tumorigenes TaxID=2041385 RepID=UPI003100DE0B
MIIAVIFYSRAWGWRYFTSLAGCRRDYFLRTISISSNFVFADPGQERQPRAEDAETLHRIDNDLSDPEKAIDSGRDRKAFAVV